MKKVRTHADSPQARMLRVFDAEGARAAEYHRGRRRSFHFEKLLQEAVAHNVLLLNGKGPAPSSNPQVVTWSVDERVEFASAKVGRDGLTHQRSVLFVKPNYWVVVDHVSGKPKGFVRLHVNGG